MDEKIFFTMKCVNMDENIKKCKVGTFWTIVLKHMDVCANNPRIILFCFGLVAN